MKVKSADQVAAKWSQRAGAAGQAYKDGVTNPKNPWASATEAAAQNWATGVQNAVSGGRFVKGVAKVGDGGWSAGAINKGAARYPQGVAASQGKYQSGISSVLSTLSSIQLPARFPKGDPQNLQRVAAIATALRKLKTG